MFTDIELEGIAILIISNYFDGEYTEEYIQENFKLALKVLIENIKSTSKLTGVKSISENGISISYEDGYEKFSLTSDVLALLPNKKNFKVW